MAYIGKINSPASFTTRIVDTMTGDGSDTTLTLSGTPINVCVYIDGVFQKPTVEYNISGNTVTFTTAPGTGCNVVAISGGGETIAAPADGSVTVDDIVDNAILPSKILSMDAAKLTGNLPVMDGSALTNITSSGVLMKNTSEPTTSTNPSGGVGTVWIDKTTGNMYVCTDATAGSNVWANVGDGSINIGEFEQPGTIKGFMAGGYSDSTINSINFVNDEGGTDVGNLPDNASHYNSAGGRSITTGYIFSGNVNFNDGNGTQQRNPKIAKFPFANPNGGSHLTNELTTGRSNTMGASNKIGAYVMGGVAPAVVKTITKCTFATDAVAVKGDLFTTNSWGSGTSSETHGYTMCGLSTTSGSSKHKNIEKFAFATDGDAVDVGDLIETRYSSTATMSTTHSYCNSGYVSGGPTRAIERFAFASDSSGGSGIGDMLSPGDYNMTCTSSTTHGFYGGGDAQTVRIQKHAYSSSANSTSVGNLTVAMAGGGTCNLQH